MNVEVSQIDVALTGSGTAQGVIALLSTTGILPGAIGQLYQVVAGTLQSLTVQVVAVIDGTHLSLRIAAQAATGPIGSGPVAASGSPGFGQTLTQNIKPNYGYSDVSAFTTGNSARFCQNAQIVRVEPASQAAPLV